MAKTWKVVTSPRARFVLAGLLLNRKLVFKTRKQDRELRRAREALGLIGLTETLLQYKRVNEAYAADSRTLHVFEVSQDDADLMIECREKVELNGFDSMVLADLFEQLEEARDPNKLGSYANPFSESAELPLWVPSHLPVFEGPDRFYDVLRDTLTSSRGNFARWSASMLATLDPAPEPNGQDTAQVSP